jgi:hypothetical protein
LHPRATVCREVIVNLLAIASLATTPMTATYNRAKVAASPPFPFISLLCLPAEHSVLPKSFDLNHCDQYYYVYGCD